MAPRKTYSAGLKAQAVLALLKEDQTFGQVAAKFGVHHTFADASLADNAYGHDMNTGLDPTTGLGIGAPDYGGGYDPSGDDF